MHNRSEIEFHGLHKAVVIGDIDISHLCHNALCIRLNHSSMEPQEHMHEQIKGANHRKCKSHGTHTFSCI